MLILKGIGVGRGGSVDERRRVPAYICGLN